MFKLRVLSLFFLFAFAGSKAFEQTNEPNSNVEKYEDDKNGQFKDYHSGVINILLRNGGEVDLKLPYHANYYYFDQNDENDEAPLLMKRGKGGKWKHGGRWKGRGRGGWNRKPWKNRGYGNYGGGGPGYNNDWY